MALPIKRFVDVEIRKDSPVPLGVGFDTTVCFSTLAGITDPVKYSDYDSVVLAYTDTSEEAKVARAYFNQDPFNTYQPKILWFVKVDTLDLAGAQAALLAADNAGVTASAFGMTKPLRDSATFPAVMATEIEARSAILVVADDDVLTLDANNTTNLSYVLMTADRERTAVIYHDDPTLYPDFAWLGQQVPKPLGSTNWAYKTFAGARENATDIPTVILTEAQKDAASGFNCNVYSTTLDNIFTFFGTTASGEYIDIIRNIDFLTAQLNNFILRLFIERDILAMTDGGITVLENRIHSTLDTYGTKQGILIDGTVIVNLPKRSDIDAATREARTVPGGTFQGELQGAINKLVLRGTVYI